MAVGLGLVAIVSVMLSGLLVMFDLTEPMSTTQIVLALPIFLQEMVLAVWLSPRGSTRLPSLPNRAGETSLRPAA